jgi:hypothetical protein
MQYKQTLARARQVCSQIEWTSDPKKVAERVQLVLRPHLHKNSAPAPESPAPVSSPPTKEAMPALREYFQACVMLRFCMYANVRTWRRGCVRIEEPILAFVVSFPGSKFLLPGMFACGNPSGLGSPATRS